MADNMNNKNDLKSADSEKAFGTSGQNSMTEVGIKLGEAIGVGAAKRKRGKRLPLVLDVVAAVLLVAIVVGVAVGAYHLFRFYTDDYEGVEVEYTFILVSERVWEMNYRALRNKGLYLDTGDNTIYFGSVVGADIVALEDDPGAGMLTLTVRANVKYKADEGYSIEGNRIAVGSEYRLRSETLTIDGAIVELVDLTSKEGGN